MVPMTPTVPPAIAAVISLTVGPMTTPFKLSRSAYPVPMETGSIARLGGRRAQASDARFGRGVDRRNGMVVWKAAMLAGAGSDLVVASRFEPA